MHAHSAGKFLILAIWLIFGAIWPGLVPVAQAASVPNITSLGHIDEGMSVPTDLAMDGEGNLYVAEPRSKTVVKYDPYGVPVKTLGPLPVSVASLAVHTDSDGHITLYGAGESAVLRMNAEGEVLDYVGGGPDAFERAFDLAVDHQGFLFVADSQARQISVFDGSGSLQFRFGSPGTGDSQFSTLTAMEVDPYAEEIYVADNYAEGSTVEPRIRVFDFSGNYKRSLPAKSGFGSSALVSFGGIAFDDQGRGYFLDSLKNQVRILSLPSTFLKVHSSSGYNPGQLVAPSSAVYDDINSRLLVLCPDGRIELFGVDGGSNPVKLNSPPQTPVPVSPLGGSEVDSLRPTLIFDNAHDGDDDLLTYDVQVWRDGAVVAEMFDVSEGASQTSAVVTQDLEENMEHTWRVQAFDGTDISDWSAFERFYVNAVQEPPTRPVITLPEQGAVIEAEDFLAWDASLDPDPSDKVSYQIALFDGAEETEPLVEQDVETTSVTLGDLSSPISLRAGQTYYLQVQAVDEHGEWSDPSERREFVYGASVLQVRANLPGCRVYLGGNHAYPGRYMGETPLEVSELAPGEYTLVIERAGCETDLRRVEVVAAQETVASFDLRPVLIPEDFVRRAVTVTRGGGELVAPFMVDWDGDGSLDLLAADRSGRLLLLSGSEAGVDFFDSAEVLPLPLIPGATPFVADWNNDQIPDLLVGGQDGSVLLFRGTAAATGGLSFDGGSYLQANGAPLAVASDAVPVVVDFNLDGAKDLIVGDGDGEVRLFLNQGSDAAPQFAQGILLKKFDAAAAPFFADLDGDGRRDLVVAAGGEIDGFSIHGEKDLSSLPGIHLSVHEGVRKGATSLPEVAQAEEVYDKRRKKSKAPKKTENFMPEVRHFFIADLDEGAGKDMMVVDDEGMIYFLEAQGEKLSPHFIEAMQEKLDFMAADFSASAAICSEISTKLADGRFGSARELVEDWAESVAVDTELGLQVMELRALMPHPSDKVWESQ
jgi:hypothetical protein